MHPFKYIPPHEEMSLLDFAIVSAFAHVKVDRKFQAPTWLETTLPSFAFPAGAQFE